MTIIDRGLFGQIRITKGCMGSAECEVMGRRNVGFKFL